MSNRVHLFPLQPPCPSYHCHLLTLVTGAESSFEHVPIPSPPSGHGGFGREPLGPRGTDGSKKSQTLGSNPFIQYLLPRRQREEPGWPVSVTPRKVGGQEQFQGAKRVPDVLTSILQHNWEQHYHLMNMTLVRIIHFSKVTEKIYVNYSKGYTISMHCSALCIALG